MQYLQAGDFEGARSLTAPGSPAFVFADGLALLNDPVTVQPANDGQYVVGLDVGSLQAVPVVLSTFVLTEGLIADLLLDGKPLAEIIIASGETYEDGGITSTIHSFRYFGSALQVVITTTNNGDQDGGLNFTRYVTGGQQYYNGFAEDVYPTVTLTWVNRFIDVPPGPGTLYGAVYVGSLGRKLEVAVPDIG